MARRGLTLALCAAVMALPVAPSWAQKKQQKELARIQSELRKTLAELESLRSSEAALGKDVSRLEGLDENSRKRTERLQAVIRSAEARRADLKSRLDSASRVDGFWSAALSVETARHAALAQSRSDFFDSKELWAEEFRRTAIIEKARHLRGLKGFRRRTEVAEADARRRADEFAVSRRQVLSERDDRRKEYEAKKAQLSITQNQVAQAARRAKDLEESAKAMTALIDKLGKAGKYRKPSGSKASLDVPRHSLPWPAQGRVVSSFGREKDPELGTWIVRQGLTVETTPGAAVSSVAAGHVIFEGPFRSYGQVVIVDHGGGFFSIYGGLGQIVKDKGAETRAGETIARAGEGGDGTPSRLYFEIRRGTEALDPAAWLSSKEGK